MNAITDERTNGSAAHAANTYAARGWSVIPLLPASKLPALKWEKYQHTRATSQELAQRFRRWANANVGIVTGEISNLVVLDVDPGHGGDASLSRIEAVYGKLPITIEAATGGAGRHFYFAHPGRLVPNRAGIAPGIDVRGDGGYVVAPPSRHPSGQSYAWVSDCSPSEMTLAPLPRWLMAIGAARRVGRPVEHWRVLVRDGVSEGKRNSTIASLGGHLLWHGVDPDVVLQLLLAWNRCCSRPPLEDTEVSQVVDSIVRLHENR